MKSLAVITLLVLGCSAAFAQTSYSYGFLSAGARNEYCNYEAITVGGGGNFYLQGYDVLSPCPGFKGSNAVTAGFRINVPIVAFAPVYGNAYAYADALYDAYYGTFTGLQWVVLTKTTPTKLRFGNYSWAGYVGFFGYEFLGNYGFLTNTIPSASNSNNKLSIGSMTQAKVASMVKK